MPVTSIIIPVFNEQENIPLLYEEILKFCNHDLELLFVDDGSKDNTLLQIQALTAKDKRVKCISFSRNFGHQNALMAGMGYATGERIITMDGDLQHPPSLIPAMLNQLDEGFDIVSTKRNKTEDAGAFKTLLAKVFYRFINSISDTHIEANAADFRAFNRKVLEAVLQFREREVFLRGLFSWVGFRSTSIGFEAPARQHGKTKYSFGKMLKFALKGTTSFSFKPLRLAFIIGAVVSLCAFAFAIFALVSYIKHETVPGWASTIIAIMFLGGTQLLAIGLLGEYIASLFVETKNRPLFLVDKTINL